LAIFERQGAVMYRGRESMKAPVVLVTAALTVAILLAAALMIATGTHGENAPRPPAERILQPSPAAK
jgi:hypothetical protein